MKQRIDAEKENKGLVAKSLTPNSVGEITVIAGAIEENHPRLEEIAELGSREFSPYNEEYRSIRDTRGLSKNQKQSFREYTRHQLVWYRLQLFLNKVLDDPRISRLILKGIDKSSNLVIAHIDVSNGKQLNIVDTFEKLHEFEDFLEVIDKKTPGTENISERAHNVPLQLKWATREGLSTIARHGLGLRIARYNMWAMLRGESEFHPDFSRRINPAIPSTNPETGKLMAVPRGFIGPGPWAGALRALAIYGLSLDELNTLYYALMELKPSIDIALTRKAFGDVITQGFKKNAINVEMKAIELSRKLNKTFFSKPTETKVVYADNDEKITIELIDFIKDELNESEAVCPAVTNIWINRIVERFSNQSKRWQNAGIRGDTIQEALRNEMMHAEVNELYWRGGGWNLISQEDLSFGGRILIIVYNDAFDPITALPRAPEQIKVKDSPWDWYYDAEASVGHLANTSFHAGASVIDQILCFRNREGNAIYVFVEDRVPKVLESGELASYRSYMYRHKNAFLKSHNFLQEKFAQIMSDSTLSELFRGNTIASNQKTRPWGTDKLYPAIPTEELTSDQIEKALIKGFAKAERKKVRNMLNDFGNKNVLGRIAVYRVMDVQIEADQITEIRCIMIVNAIKIDPILKQTIEILAEEPWSNVNFSLLKTMQTV